jgi:hypothetical protein
VHFSLAALLLSSACCVVFFTFALVIFPKWAGLIDELGGHTPVAAFAAVFLVGCFLLLLVPGVWLLLRLALSALRDRRSGGRKLDAIEVEQSGRVKSRPLD